MTVISTICIVTRYCVLTDKIFTFEDKAPLAKSFAFPFDIGGFPECRNPPILTRALDAGRFRNGSY